jgi:hypothetical protein
MTESNVRQYVVIPAGETVETMAGKEVETIELPAGYRNDANMANWYYANKKGGDPNSTCVAFEVFAGVKPPEPTPHNLEAQDIYVEEGWNLDE